MWPGLAVGELGRWVEVTPECQAKEVGTLSHGDRGLGGV